MINELEILALKAVALKDSEYFTRKICRYYSEKFHTPLDQVYNLPWPFVFSNYIEHIIENNNTQEEIYNLSLEIFYPEKKKVKNFLGEFNNEEEEIEAWIKNIEKEEQQKRNNSTVKKESKQTIEQNNDPHIELDMKRFEHLDKEMEEDE